MTIYCLDGQKAKDFVSLCNKVKINLNKTCQDFLDNGFTNYYEPDLYFCRRIKYKDNYPVSFNIFIQKNKMKLSSFEIIDEEFGQPHFCDDTAFIQIKNIINELLNKELFVLK